MIGNAFRGKTWLLVALVTAFVHIGSLDGVFHYDDDHSVVRNTALRDVSFVPSYFLQPELFSADPGRGMYRPVLLTSFVLNRVLIGDDALAFLLVNLLLHAANATLICVVARRWLSAHGSALAGLLFGLHPVVTEPVNYVSARSDSLVAFFLLLAITWGIVGVRRQQRVWGQVGAVALALLAKSTAIAAGAVLILTHWLHTHRWQESFRKQWRVLVVSGLYLAMIWANGFLPHSLSRQTMPLAERLLTQAKAPAHYLLTLVMPTGLSPEPAFSLATHASAAVVGSMVMTISMVCVAFVLCRRHLRAPWALMLWFGFTLVPVSLAPLNVLVNDRRLYLPLAGAAIAFACTGALVERPFWRRTLAMAGLAILAVLSIERSQVWASDIRLWSDATAKAPMMPRPQLYLGDALSRQATSPVQNRAARVAYERVLSLEPEQRLLAFQATNGLALLDRAEGKTQQELQRLQDLVAIAPSYADAWANLGNAWYAAALTGDSLALPKALKAYERALQLNPTHANAHVGRGAILQVTGHLVEAEVAYRSSLRLTSPASQAAMNLAGLYMMRARLSTDSEQRVDLLRSARAVFVDAAAAGNAAAAAGIRAVDDSLAAAQRQR